MKSDYSEIIELFIAGIEAVKPAALIKENIWLEGKRLNINCSNNSNMIIDLDKYENIYLIGAGKASVAMAEKIEAVLEDMITKGIVVAKYGLGRKLKKIELLFANHPIPDKNGIDAAIKITELCKLANENDLVINLLSGGASALLPMPVKGITLDEKIEVTDQLLKSGAAIDEMNIIRSQLSQIKGRGLLQFIYPAQVVSIIISDVIGDNLKVIGSGNTFQVEYNFDDCWRIIEKYSFQETFPCSVTTNIKNKLNYANKSIEKNQTNVTNIIIGNNVKALNKIKEKADSFGYVTKIVSNELKGESKIVGKQIVENAIFFRNEKTDKNCKYCFLYGGETTVSIKGNGKGGRNQELVLAATIALDGINGITMLSGGTDGNDGPTDVAGAVCNGETIQIAKKKGLNAKEYLERNDSYNYFNAIDSLIITGPTGTNVMDIQIVLIETENKE